MPTHILKRILQVQLVRQLLGAATGSIVALALYYAYGVVQDSVHAYLMHDESTSLDTIDGAYADRATTIKNIGALARERLKQLD